MAKFKIGFKNNQETLCIVEVTVLNILSKVMDQTRGRLFCKAAVRSLDRVINMQKDEAI